MPKPLPQSVSSELVVSWWERYKNLRALMSERPDDPAYGVWAIRRKILTYLVRRYDSGTAIRELIDDAELEVYVDIEDETPEANQDDLPPGIPVAENEPVVGPDATDEVPVRFHTRQGLRNILHEFFAPKNPPIVVSLSYPEEGYELPNERLIREQRQIVIEEIASIMELIPEDDDLTEDEILAILSGKVD